METWSARGRIALSASFQHLIHRTGCRSAIKPTSRAGHKAYLDFVPVAQGASVGLFGISFCPAFGVASRFACPGIAALRRVASDAVAVFAMVLVAVALCGCSAAPLIDSHAADYRDTEASAGDAQLLQNILRAKDNLPIHFADLSNIHGSIQLTAAGTASVAFANLIGSTVPSTAGPTLSAQTSPTFDVGTLDSQDFTKGLLSEIDPRIIKTLFDQGIDPRIMMLLFFCEYRNSRGERFINNFACDRSHPVDAERGCFNRVYDYLHEIDGLIASRGLPQQLQANVYVILSPIGGTLAGSWSLKDNLGDLRQLDTSKYKLIGKRLYSISQPLLAICQERNHRLYPLFDQSVTGTDSCTKSEVIVEHPSRANYSLWVRSTYDMLQFLGQVLRFQEEKGNNRCLTLDAADRRCDSGEVLFQVNAPKGRPVVATRYGDRSYALSDRGCRADFEQPCDNSLQVLAILELLLNANKAAKDIIATPRVQVVP
jgi:hypothetical protein